jgi:hypothetical protein
LIFASELYENILTFQQNYPDFRTIFAGDLNTCLSGEEDSLNRNRTKSEDTLANLITENNKVIEVVDAYREKNCKEGYTWKRGLCYSRLDYVFISKSISHRIGTTKTDWAYENSDHAALTIKITIEDKPIGGPGLIRVNTRILDKPGMVKKIEGELEEMMKQADDSWNPHVRLEFMKVCIRSVFAINVSEERNQERKLIEEKEDELNQIEELKISTLKAKEADKTQNIDKIDRAVDTLKCELIKLRDKQSKSINFMGRAKWFEYGERSNKFFLNLNKSHQRQKLISRIRKDDVEHVGQKQVSDCIRDFYQDLYSIQQPTEVADETFYDKCPKLSPNNKKFMDEKLELRDLWQALGTCKDSAPGPDGIPYVVYRKLWKQTGQTILDAWNYSMTTGTLTTSHVESIITLLPKEGKDIRDIKNWRPITLSNCDSKIITKAIALKMAKVLDSIIDSSQTAYVPGRSVADNLRANFYLKGQCKKKKMDSVLISLDAKKAFDSVDHTYIGKTLKAYGFGDYFIKSFQILYKDITARVLVNGFTTNSIKIQRGVKQGDALSCAIFIICIDPLLRNLNCNTDIKNVNLNNSGISFKAAAYADDISVICRNNYNSVQQVFKEYERLTKLSGLELNADKTEILILNSELTQRFKFKYNNSLFDIISVHRIKICGLYYCSDTEKEYELNVKEKIQKLNHKIRAWTHRHLSMEGKVLIIKTFGISQLIYNMQMYSFRKEELIDIERSIFKFMWSSSEKQNGIDRIKRSIMKNDFESGGLNVTDIECLNRSLKLKQFIRANNTNHGISLIQSHLTGKVLKSEYYKITKDEAICESAQETINVITNYNRSIYDKKTEEEIESDKLLINEVSSINLETYLRNKNKVFHLCLVKPITHSGIETIGELIQAYEYERDEKLLIPMKMIIGIIPKSLIDISKCFNDEINHISESFDYMMIAPDLWHKTTEITVKQLQKTLKTALGKTETLDFKTKLKIDHFDKENIVTFRQYCKNPKLRNIYFRLIHNDFFTHVRMKKYNMITTDSCPRCGEVEDTKHLLWECRHVAHIWKLYNSKMDKIGSRRVTSYEEVYTPGNSLATCNIKIKLIQEMIQIDRPKNWTMENINNLINSMKMMELHTATMNNSTTRYNLKWNHLDGHDS